MENKYFYTINKSLTNRFDTNPLRIVGFVEVFNDKEKNKKLTDISFNELEINLAFADCPHESKETFDKFIEDKVKTGLQKEEIQDKIKEIETAADLGLFDLLDIQ
ncbi:hypothetical protein [Clostridium botulinum]|uniref:hypothetical protein n=1 Tax=Clostridium botulinum TaxID=1491 RepID=UPI0006A53A6E|nr:hypothetical protein [Clostridium botulinum]KOC32556.1 hypothetical protein ADU81_11155 [Clostridium botulinum]